MDIGYIMFSIVQIHQRPASCVGNMFFFFFNIRCILILIIVEQGAYATNDAAHAREN